MKYFEQRLDEENIKAKKTAWVVASLSLLLNLVLAGAVFHMTPLKRTEVKVMVVDKNTGYPAEVTALSEFEQGNIRQISASDALNKYFAQQYIIAHDSYNYYAIRDAYATVQLFSTPEVMRQYKAKFEPPMEIEKQFGRNKVLEVSVITLTPQQIATPFGDGENGITMQARVEKTIREGNKILERDSGTVTLTFGYDADLEMDEKARNANPFGFTVTSYRYDPDQLGGQ